MDTIAFMRIHQFNERQWKVMNQIAQHCDGVFFLMHDLVSPKMYDLAENHPKCVEIRCWTKDFSNLAQLQYCLQWASEIRPRYVFEFDEDEIPPPKLGEVLYDFKKSYASTLWFKGVWAYNDIGQIAIEPMRRYFFHMKIYKWSECMARKIRSGFCSFKGITQHSNEAFLSKYPLIHLAFLTERLRERRMQVGNSKGHQYNETSWFMAKDVRTVPFDKHKTNEDWMKLYEALCNNLEQE